MDISGSFVFSIGDTKLDFNNIQDNLLIKPTKIIKKGQMIGKMENIEAPYDIWSYEIAITDSENIFNDLSLLLDNLLPCSTFIKEVISTYKNVVISCYLRSDYAQIGFQLNNEIITKLEQLGLCLDFHILSFGRVNA